MIAVVHKTFGNIIFADTCFFVYFAALQYHFMSDKAGCPAIDDAIGVLEAGSQIIGIQNGYLGGACQSLRTHHAYIAVGNGQNTRTAERSSRYLIGCIAKKFVSR